MDVRTTLEMFVEQDASDFLSPPASIERFMLSGTDVPKTRHRFRWLEAMALPYDLDQARSSIDAAAEHGFDVALPGSEDVLPREGSFFATRSRARNRKPGPYSN